MSFSFRHASTLETAVDKAGPYTLTAAGDAISILPIDYSYISYPLLFSSLLFIN
jgi:hypothetical protein